MSRDNVPPTAAEELPLSGFHDRLERCVEKLGGGKVKHCARNAFAHLRKAWTIQTIDPGMALLRGITAEEEAASALLLSLQQKHYLGAERLNHRSHVQKSALTPFMNGVAKVLQTVEFAEPILGLNPDETPPTVSIRFDVNNVGMKMTDPMFASPDPPLNFSIGRGTDGRRAHMFEEELQEIASGNGVDAIAKFIEDEANMRNRVLYAADEGIPGVRIGDSFLIERLRRVTVLLVLTVAIQQTPIHQLFVQQCLRAFLFALGKIKETEFEFEPPPRANGLLVEIIKEPDREPQAWLGWR